MDAHIYLFGFVALLVGAALWWLVRWKTRLPFKIVSLVIVPAWLLLTTLVFVIAALGMHSWARSHVRQVAESALKATARVEVDFLPAPDSHGVLIGISQLHGTRPRGSHPIGSWRIDLSTANSALELVVKRDSARPNEYWVFWPAFSKITELGRIEADGFAHAIGDNQQVAP